MIIVDRLREIQNAWGYLPDAELTKLARLLGVPLYRVQEVASFYAAFRQEWDKPAVVEVRVCRDMACHHAGARHLFDPARPGGGLAEACGAKTVAADLLRNGPKWAAEARAEKDGKRAAYENPDAGRCRVVVEGVSCLGRCDRAPAVWVERQPMPTHEHAWVFARDVTGGEDVAAFRDRLARALAAVAADPRLNAHPPHDADVTYQPHTATGVRYAPPAVGPAEANAGGYHPPLPAAGWEIDIYRGAERDYKVARMVAAELKERRGLAPWPPADELRRRYAKAIGDEKTKARIDKAVADAVAKANAALTPLQRQDLAAEARQKEEDKVAQKAFIEYENRFLAEVGNSRLQGMGGAGAPAYQKWLDVWVATPQDTTVLPAKYVVCNGDESEPGTFKDRELLLRTPHLVVEGMVLAGLMTGATAGYVFIRHEYPEQIHAVRAEVERAAHIRACGRDVFGTGISFPITVVESPGGYICGEQSALIEAMEDHRAQPRNRPPELQANGLWDMPTTVNNVETLAWAPYICEKARGGGKGGEAYVKLGWEVPAAEIPFHDLPEKLRPKDGEKPRRVGFVGRRLFSISGDVNRPGVYEVPVGLPLRELVMDPEYCGGITQVAGLPPRGVKAVATSGPSGGLLPARLPLAPGSRAKMVEKANRLRDDAVPVMRWFLDKYLAGDPTHLDILDIPLDLNFFRNLPELFPFKVEPMLGAGLVVYADGTDTFDAAVNFTEFYRNESCGKCVPCRVGSQKLVQIGTEMLAKRDAAALDAAAVFEPGGVRDDVREFMSTLQKTSICGLGYVAPSPLASALEYFRPDVERKPT